MKKIIAYMPIIFIEFYLTITVILFAFGPFDYPITHPIKLYSLLFIYQIFLFLGYLMSVKFYRKKKEPIHSTELWLFIIKILLIINIFFILFLMIREFGLEKFSIRGIVDRIVLGVRNPGKAYNLKFLVTSNNIFGGLVGSLFILVFQPIAYLVVPFALVYFKRLNIIYRLLTIINILLNICHAIGIGTNKGVFDMLILIFITCFLFLLKYFNEKGFNKKYLINIGITLIILAAFILGIFNKNLSNRGVGGTLNNNEVHSIGLNTVPYDTECLIFEATPSVLHKPIALLSSYLTQGYYGLDITMNTGVIPMFGIGNSMFLQKYISKYAFDISQLSLQFRSIPYNWDPYVNWHSLYSWYANDFGFLGVTVILMIFGYLFGNCYLKTLDNNVFAKVLFMLLFIMLLFLPMNSQIFSFMHSFLAFFIALFLYIIFDK